MTGLVSQHKLISRYSVLPRIVARPCIIIEDSDDESVQIKLAARNKIITDHFNKVKPEASSSAGMSDNDADNAGGSADSVGGITDHPMAIDPSPTEVGNIFQLAAHAKVTKAAGSGRVPRPGSQDRLCSLPR